MVDILVKLWDGTTRPIPSNQRRHVELLLREEVSDRMASAALISYLEDRTGEYLRRVVRYDGETPDVLYLRDDTKKQRFRRQISRMLRRVRPEPFQEGSEQFRSAIFG